MADGDCVLFEPSPDRASFIDSGWLNINDFEMVLLHQVLFKLFRVGFHSVKFEDLLLTSRKQCQTMRYA